MSRLSSVAERHPLITFFVLTYALSWTFEIPLVVVGDGIAGTRGLVLNLLAANVPSVLAIVLTVVVFGRGALRELLGRLLIWRVDPLWYLVVLGPAALAGAMVALNTLLGGPDMGLGVPLLTAVIMLAFFIFPGSALGEEVGWRGYVLPRLQSGRSALGASLILGVIWGFYHLPLYFTGQAGRPLGLFPVFVVATIALSVIMTWVYNGTGGSLLVVVLLHATYNLPLTLLIAPLGSRVTVPFLLYVGLLVVAAIAVVIVAGPKHLSRKHRKQEERAVEPGVATPGVVKPTPS
jgi:membrane protease YdiL (CAAX protease family)